MIQLINDDCLIAMRKMDDNSIDAIVTDPPYGLKFMGQKWDYNVPSIEIWAECLRVLKPGGYLLAFAGTRTQHRMACNIEDAGFEIRDMIGWIYGQGFPKSQNIGKAVDKIEGNDRDVIGILKTFGTPIHKGNYKKGIEINNTSGSSEWEGWGTNLKPALEPITMARKPITEKTIAANCLKWGTGAINIDKSRIGGGEYNNNTSGRWPANIIIDDSEEVEGIFPQSKSSVFRATNKSIFDPNSGWNSKGTTKNNKTQGYSDNGSASRFFYCAKTSKKERGEDNSHPTVKPIKLMEYLITLISRESNTILDPFMGSGSTGIAAKNLNRRFIGIELNIDYFNIAKKRIK